MRTAIYCLACALIGAGAVKFWPSSSASGPRQHAAASDGSPPGGDTRNDDSRLEALMFGMNTRIAALESLAKQRADAPAAPPGQDSTDAPLAPASESREEHKARMTAETEARLKTEHRDQAWATETEAQIRNAAQTAAGENGQYKITNLSCLSTVCTTEFAIPEAAMASGRMPMFSFPHRVRGMGGFSFTPPEKQQNGTYKLSYVFYRSGHPIPGYDETPLALSGPPSVGQ